jgi:hypothetical protein
VTARSVSARGSAGGLARGRGRLLLESPAEPRGKASGGSVHEDQRGISLTCIHIRTSDPSPSTGAAIAQKARPETRVSSATGRPSTARPGLRDSPRLVPSIRGPRACCAHPDRHLHRRPPGSRIQPPASGGRRPKAEEVWMAGVKMIRWLGLSWGRQSSGAGPRGLIVPGLGNPTVAAGSRSKGGRSAIELGCQALWAQAAIRRA